MALPILGSIPLGRVTLRTAPAPTAPFMQPKRYSAHPVDSGHVEIQDGGLVPVDNQVRLAARTGVLDTTAVRALHRLYRAQGATYLVTDWLGNQFRALIADFKPEAF